MESINANEGASTFQARYTTWRDMQKEIVLLPVEPKPGR